MSEATQTQTPAVESAPTPKAPAKARGKARAAKAATPKKGTPKAAPKAVQFQSLTGGGARPALFSNKVPKEIEARYPAICKLMQRLHESHNVLTVSCFVSQRPDSTKSARVSDWFKLSWTKAGKKADLPATFAKSTKVSMKKFCKLDPAFGTLAKLPEAIVYFTLEKGSKKVTLNGSYKE
jgi:hypothetical protein